MLAALTFLYSQAREALLADFGKFKPYTKNLPEFTPLAKRVDTLSEKANTMINRAHVTKCEALLLRVYKGTTAPSKAVERRKKFEGHIKKLSATNQIASDVVQPAVWAVVSAALST